MREKELKTIFPLKWLMEKLLSFDIVTSDFNQATAALEIQDFQLASIINDSTNIYMAFDVIINANMRRRKKIITKINLLVFCLTFLQNTLR